MEIIIYTDNLQACLHTSVFKRYPEGVTCPGAWEREQLEGQYPAALLASSGQHLFDSEMLVREVKLHKPLKFRDELLERSPRAKNLKVAIGLDRYDLDFLLYKYSGMSARSILHKDVPGQSWEKEGAANE